eukprot:gene20192-31050_t
MSAQVTPRHASVADNASSLTDVNYVGVSVPRQSPIASHYTDPRGGRGLNTSGYRAPSLSGASRASAASTLHPLRYAPTDGSPRAHQQRYGSTPRTAVPVPHDAGSTDAGSRSPSAWRGGVAEGDTVAYRSGKPGFRPSCDAFPAGRTSSPISDVTYRRYNAWAPAHDPLSRGVGYDAHSSSGGGGGGGAAADARPAPRMAARGSYGSEWPGSAGGQRRASPSPAAAPPRGFVAAPTRECSPSSVSFAGGGGPPGHEHHHQQVQHHQVQHLQSALETEASRRRSAELRARQLESEQRGALALQRRAADLQQQLEYSSTRAEDATHRLEAVQRRLTELESDPGGKHLQGKLVGLQSMLADKRSEADDLRRQLDESTHRERQAAAALDAEREKRSSLAGELGVQCASTEERKMEAEALRRRVLDLERRLSADVDQCTENDNAVHDAVAAVQRDLAAVSQADRDKAHLLSEAEQANAHLRAQLADVTTVHQRSRDDVVRCEAQVNDLQNEVSRLLAELDAKSSAAAEAAACLSIEREAADRDRETIHELSHDLAQAEVEKNASDTALRDVEQKLEAQCRLEERLAVLVAALERAEDALEQEAARHRGTKRRVDELESRTERLNAVLQKNTSLEASQRDDQNSIENLRDALADLRRQLAEQRQDTDDEATRHALTLDTVKRLEAEKRELQSELDASRHVVSSKNILEGRVKAYEDVVATKDSELRHACSDLEHTRRRLDDCERKLHAAEASAEASQERVAGLVEKMRHMESLVQGADHVEADLVAELDEMRAHASVLEASEANHLQHVARLEDQLALVQQQATAEKQQLVSAEIDSLRRELAASSATVADLEDKLTEAEHAVDAKQARIDDLTMQVGEKDIRLESMAEDMQMRAIEVGRLADEAAAANIRENLLEDDTAALRQVLEEARVDQARHAAEVADLEDTVRNQSKALSRAEADAAAERERNAALSHRVSCLLDSDTDRLQLQARLDEMHRSYGEQVATVNEREQELADLRRSLKQRDALATRADQLEAAHAAAKAQLEAARREIDDLSSARSADKDTMSALECQLAAGQAELRALRQEADRQAATAAASKAACDGLQRECSQAREAQAAASAFEAELAAKNDELRNTALQGKALRGKIRQLEMLLADRAADGERVEGLRREVQLKTDSIDLLQREADRCQRVVAELGEDLDKQQEKCSELEEQLQVAFRGSHALELQLKDRESDVVDREKRARDAVRIAKEEKQRLEADIRELEDRGRHLASLLDLERANNKEMTIELDKQRDAVARFEGDSGRAAVEWNDVCDRLQAEQQAAAAAKRSSAQLRRELDAAREEAADGAARHAARERQLLHELRVKEDRLVASGSTAATLRSEITKITSSAAACETGGNYKLDEPASNVADRCYLPPRLSPSPT